MTEEQTMVCPGCGLKFTKPQLYAAHDPNLCRWMHRCQKCEGKLKTKGQKKVCTLCGWSRDLQ